MGEFEAVALTPSHLKAFEGFTCGSGNEWCDTLNDFLVENALLEAAGRFNTTYVFYVDEAPVAYATLSAGEIPREPTRKLLGGRSPYSTIPALHVGRLAVSESRQGGEIGETVLGWIETQAVELKIGCRFLVLFADRENVRAIRFYERYGFEAPEEINRGRRQLIMLYDLIDSQANSPSNDGRAAS